MAPVTRYARSGELHIAYQVIGESAGADSLAGSAGAEPGIGESAGAEPGSGKLDLLYVPSWISQVEHYWEEPALARYFNRLAGFSRLIMFDRRGSGLSDPVPEAPTLEEQVDDILAVMAAAGSERAAVFALLEGGAMAALFAATHPERVTALVLMAAQPRMSWAPDYEWAIRREDREAYIVGGGMSSWGDGARLANLAPGAETNPRLRAWYGKLERLAAAPGMATKLMRMNSEVDVRAVLPTIQAPTLVLHRREDPFIDVRHSHYTADHIPGAKLVLLPGGSSLSFGGEAVTELDEIEEFLTGARHVDDTERILATVMFADVVDSTSTAARVGDGQWRDTLAALERVVGRDLMRFRGRAVKQMGDGFLATFDGPARAIRCATSIRDCAREEHGLQIRCGLHTGEIELIGEDVGGIAVHIGARVEALAQPGEVLVSGTVKDLVAGSGIAFEDRGEHELKGIPERWRLYAVAAAR
jgi:class 3 adenylate cyclase/alpha-beta hydrolase superfamily lysophospholipase